MAKQNVNYFQHDYNARNNIKLLKVRIAHGAAGYGAYFMLIEKMAEANGKLLLDDLVAIAYELKIEEEMLRDIVNNYGLFVKQLGVANTHLRSKRLDEQLEHRGMIANKRQKAGQKGGLAKAKQLLSKPLAKPSIVKERKEEESKVKESKVKESKKITPDGVEQVQSFGNQEINKMLQALKAKIEIGAFADSSIERNMALHCVNLMSKLGVKEFSRRLDLIVGDSFKHKNCNRIRFVYNEIKGFIEPRSTTLNL